jgi:predicted oxidoreductase
MRTYRIPQTDLAVSRIAYGCANLASWSEAPLDAAAIAKADRLIKTACEQGITLFDHADLYAFGKSEAVFGEVLKRSPGLREKLLVQSKCGQILSHGWKPGDPIGVDLSSKHILSAVEGSIRRLGIEHLDILLLHLPDALMEGDEIAEAFEVLRSSGKVRYFGVSNFNATQIQRLKKSVPQHLVVNQIHVGLGAIEPLVDGMEFTLAVTQGATANSRQMPAAGAGTLDYCLLHNIQVQAWSPLAGYLLKLPAETPPRLKRVVPLLAELAEAKGSTPAAIALAWLLQHPAHIVPIIGPTNHKHIIEDCTADQVRLGRKDWYELFAAAAGSLV